MRYFKLILLCSILCCKNGFADTLTWSSHNAYTGGFEVEISGEKGVISHHRRATDTTRTVKMVNTKNVLKYLGKLLERIPERGVGRPGLSAGDVITITNDKGVKIKRRIGHVSPPGSIAASEGSSAEKALKQVDEFKKNVDGYLVKYHLYQLLRIHFPHFPEEPTAKD